MKIEIINLLVLIVSLFLLTSCKTEKRTLEPVDSLDINKFMGDWYVVGVIPNFIEKGAKNGLESYRLNDKGNVEITYTLQKNGKNKEMSAKGFIQNEANTIWKVQFIWPIKFPYYVIDLEKNYEYTVIGLPNRKYVWIMSRDPQISDATYNQILARLDNKGYDISKIKRMEQNH
jgi:apolipoprotein D and lipocalin family protein